jgi:hypothetical protein
MSIVQALDKEGTDVCNQNLIVTETFTSFNYRNKQIILCLY